MKKRISITFNSRTATLVSTHTGPYEDEPEASPFVNKLYVTPTGAWFSSWDEEIQTEPKTPSLVIAWLINDPVALAKYFPQVQVAGDGVKNEKSAKQPLPRRSILDILLNR